MKWRFWSGIFQISGGKLLGTVAPCISEPALCFTGKKFIACFNFTLKDQNARNRHDDMSNSFLSIMQKKYIVNNNVLNDHHLRSVESSQKKIIFSWVDTQTWVSQRTRQRKIIKHMLCFKSFTSIPFLRNYFFFPFNIRFPPK